MNACSCLTLILACIIYWQAREISRIAAASNFPFDSELIRHISPIEWKNVILYGEIKINPAKLRMNSAQRVNVHGSGRYPNTSCSEPGTVPFRAGRRAVRGSSESYFPPTPAPPRAVKPC